MSEKVEIVIKIPKYYFTRPEYYIDYIPLAECIKRGVLLPEGHGRLIDADKVISDGIDKGFCDWYDELKNADAIIEADNGERGK